MVVRTFYTVGNITYIKSTKDGMTWNGLFWFDDLPTVFTKEQVENAIIKITKLIKE